MTAPATLDWRRWPEKRVKAYTRMHERRAAFRAALRKIQEPPPPVNPAERMEWENRQRDAEVQLARGENLVLQELVRATYARKSEAGARTCPT